MKKTSLALWFSVGLLVAWTSQQEPPEPPLAQRTELVVLRQSTYSDAAWIDEEEGTYIWLPQTISPFGINLSFNDADGQHKLLHTVYFKTDSAVLSTAEKRRLTRMAPVLRTQGVTLSGYADPRASTAYNNRLAKRRIDSVAAYLGHLGVTVNRECVFGETRLPNSELCEWRTE